MSKTHVEPKYYREDACFTQVEIVDVIKDLISITTETFAAHNITYFLDSGTLLGAFRDVHVISHDVDADLGIDARGLEYLQHNYVAFPEAYELNIWNSYLDPNSTRGNKLPVRIVHKASGLYVDVFAFLEWYGTGKVGPLTSWCWGNCVSCPQTSPNGKTLRVPRNWIYPLIPCLFEGITRKCPGQTETYLRYLYGDDFLTPKEDSTP
ncbi:hypothetical protein Poli38472_008837 [Pythium oligandrum]|uniref:LicD/FKTN/FKRP nucleotidyltransferase domain-containing protein n=1 Tax=Pythium oligandrum TaxID=41045 RepID=A0A8K1FCU2_PYTOL|nr:hypothetical protein Poli38472_008837 [Pythium oligandrum]|eukprot:TMW56189.1 hypothetical protein Poli38472_008837 [Pythium oligandrum]